MRHDGPSMLGMNINGAGLSAAASSSMTAAGCDAANASTRAPSPSTCADRPARGRGPRRRGDRRTGGEVQRRGMRSSSSIKVRVRSPRPAARASSCCSCSARVRSAAGILSVGGESAAARSKTLPRRSSNRFGEALGGELEVAAQRAAVGHRVRRDEPRGGHVVDEQADAAPAPVDRGLVDSGALGDERDAQLVPAMVAERVEDGGVHPLADAGRASPRAPPDGFARVAWCSLTRRLAR
jgi:hypothetical protein